jgi:hypothetical protein
MTSTGLMVCTGTNNANVTQQGQAVRSFVLKKHTKSTIHSAPLVNWARWSELHRRRDRRSSEPTEEKA